MDLEILARTLALGDGIGPRTWAASDECVRLHYRVEAARLLPRSPDATSQAPCSQEPCIAAPVEETSADDSS